MTDEEILIKIKSIIEDIRPNYQMDGGDVIFDSFENGTVHIRFEGACATLLATCYDLQDDIKERLALEISDIHEVVAVRE
jgi:Fe-S cluster biogenesis protein NfuA